MPRRNRIHYRHAFYHVMLRGNNRQNIFHHHDDYNDFITTLRLATNRYGGVVHLYCLMANHIHLVMEVTDIPLSKIMQSVSTTYAMRHNKRYDKIGHLFQGRFKSKLIQNERYLLELCFYIHMNPIKAGICQSPDEYHWSSHHIYSAYENRNSFVFTDYIKNILTNIGLTYQQFIENHKYSNIKPEHCSLSPDGELYIQDSALLQIQDKDLLTIENIPLYKIVRIICDYLDINPDELSSGSQVRKITFARAMIAYYSHYHAKHSLDEIANFFCLQRSSVSKTLHAHLQRSRTDKKIMKTMEVLEGRLSTSDVVTI